MFCQNCGNKVDDNAYVCVNCGVFLKKRSDIKIVKEKKNTNASSVISVVFGGAALLLSFLLFFHDISSVGMYTEIFERIMYVLNYSLFAILFASISLILSLIGKRNCYNNIGLMLSFISFFFIITEFIVVVIY